MKIVVLAGGISTERDVSLSTGAQVYGALKRNGHEVILLDVYLGCDHPADRLLQLFTADRDWAADISGVAETDPDLEAVKALRTDGGKSFFGPHVLELCAMADLVFLALHGANGEDGRIQAAFDLMGIPYTGTGYLSSAIAMDKGLSKQFFAKNQIPTPLGVTLKKGMELDVKEAIGFPCMVKACCGGSSVGVYKVNNQEEYEQALADAFALENEVVVEQFISGREFSVAVIEGKALPVIEIAPLVGFYDYKNKYQAGSTIETCPADLDPALAKEMQGHAEAVFAALGMEAYARMDFMLDGTTNRMYCLEANTLPGMTPTSLLPQEARAIGLTFDELCEKIVTVSLAKYTK